MSYLLRNLNVTIKSITDANGVQLRQELTVAFDTLHFAAEFLKIVPANDPIIGDVKIDFEIDTNKKVNYLCHNNKIFPSNIDFKDLTAQTTTVMVIDNGYAESAAVTRGEEDVITTSRDEEG